MALSGAELPERQLNDAIQRCDWRHAIQLIERQEKKLKKEESADWLAAVKASILLSLPEAFKRQQGRALLESLYERQPPVVDVAAIMAIESFARKRNDYDGRIDVLWTYAVNARPNDEKLHRHWFQRRFWAKDWQGARKAAMAYMKHFPSKREPFFWAIFTNFMASKSPKISGQEKALYGTMAYRMCAKAAEDVTEEAGTGKELKNGRVLRTPGDVAFLLDIYESQSKWKEAIAVLGSDRTGITSRVGKHSWDLVLRKFQLTENAGEWIDQVQYCYDLLADARPRNNKTQSHGFGEVGNNWSVWVALLRAAKNLFFLGTVKVENRTWDFVKSNGNKLTVRLIPLVATMCAQESEHSKGRNGMCARMLFDLSNLANRADSEGRGAALVEACCTYFMVYGRKSFCFDDLRMFLQALETTAMRNLLMVIWDYIDIAEDDLSGEPYQIIGEGAPGLKHINDADLLTLNVNYLKIWYYRITSLWGTPEYSEDDTGIQSFIVDCIKLYELALRSYSIVGNAERPTERLPGDDAALLAAMALMRSYSLGNRPEALLRAVTILQHLVDKSPFNFEALVTLTALYTRLGAGSLAAEQYARLSVKNIQYPTVSWLLATRISTVYPHVSRMDIRSPTDKANADPVQHLARALDYHLQLGQSDQQEIIDFLEAGQYASVTQAMGNSAYNQLGFTRYMLLVELARIERLSGVGEKPEYRRLAASMPPLPLDNRDRSPIPHWEAPDATTLEEMILPGRWPSHKWLSQQAFTTLSFDNATDQGKCFPRDDVMHSIVASNEFKESSTPAEDAQTNLARDFDWISMIYEHKSQQPDPMNRSAEVVVSKFYKLRDWQQEVNKAMSTLIQKNGCHLRQIAEGTNVPDWEFFHEVYVGLDNCKMVDKITDVVLARNHDYPIVDQADAVHHTNKIRDLCNDYRWMVQEAALKLKQSLSDKQHRRNMVFSIVSRRADKEEKGRIAFWLRYLFGNEEYVQKTMAKLNAAWKDAVTNVINLSQRKKYSQLNIWYSKEGNPL